MNKNHIGLLAGISIVIIVIVLAMQSEKPGSAISQSSPSSSTSIVGSAWQRLTSAGSAHFITQLNLSIPHTAEQIANQPIVDVAISTEGDGIWKEQPPTYTGAFKIETKGRGMQLFTDGDIRILPSTVLFKLHNLPTLLNPSGNLLEKWTRTDAAIFKVTNPEESFPAITQFFENWNKENDNTYTKTISPEEAKSLERVFAINNSGSEALHVLSRLAKNLKIDKAEVKMSQDNTTIERLELHFVHPEKTNQQASLVFAISDYGKEVAIDTPKEETSVKAEVFSQLFGEKK